MNYNVTHGKKLVLGYKYDAGGDTIYFNGFEKQNVDSVVYLKYYNGENYLIPLVDMSVTVGSPLTDKAGVFPMQLVEILDGTLIKNSPVWYGVVKNSINQSTETEITTPELNLIYAQMYEAYQDILEIQSNMITADNFDEAMQEYLEDHTISSGVTSVNGKYNDVNLDAADVGAIPATTVTQQDTTSTSAPGSAGTFEAVSEVYRNDYGQITGVDTVTVTMPTVPAETSRTDTTSTSSGNTFDVIDEIETNEYGHVTAVNTKTVTVPSSGGGGGGGGTSDDIQNTSGVTGSTVSDALDELEDQIDSQGELFGFYQYVRLVQTVDSSSDTIHYPSAKAVHTAISSLTADDIQDDSSVTQSGSVKDALTALSDEIANKGTYSKPSGGIPKTDLASAVQTSLGKADTALQTAPVTSVNGSTGAVVIGNATTSAAGLMSATDKSHLDSVYADYSSALSALGV